MHFFIFFLHPLFSFKSLPFALLISSFSKTKSTFFSLILYVGQEKVITIYHWRKNYFSSHWNPWFLPKKFKRRKWKIEIDNPPAKNAISLSFIHSIVLLNPFPVVKRVTLKIVIQKGEDFKVKISICPRQYKKKEKKI